MRKTCRGEPQNFGKLVCGIWRKLPWKTVVPNHQPATSVEGTCSHKLSSVGQSWSRW